MSDEKRIIATIKKVMPAVVSITVSKHLEDLEREKPDHLYSLLPGHPKNHKEARTIMNLFSDKDGMVAIGGGSGFIIAPDGLILTNKHVISDPKAAYTVIANDGTKYPATVVSRDPINDVAILRITAKKLPVVAFDEDPNVELGQTVIAIGNALGIFKNTVSVGIVSGLSRSISAKEDPDAPEQELRGLIQTDAAINPGNSGGPLVNLDGEAIGINAAIVFGAQNISFAIPIQAARRDLSDIRTYGHIRRPFLGVRYLLVNDILQDRMNLPVDHGAVVVSEGPHDPGVHAGSPADKAGIKEHDIIIEIDGLPVTTERSVQDYLNDRAVHDTIALTVLRNGRQFVVKALLSERM